MTDKKVIGVLAVLAIITLIVIINPQAQSVVSVSEIFVKNQGTLIQAQLSVDTDDTLFLIDHASVKAASNGQFDKVNYDVYVTAEPKGVFCTLPLTQKSITVLGQTRPYWVADKQTYATQVLTLVEVERQNPAGGPLESIGNATFNACNVSNTQCDTSVDTRSSVTFSSSGSNITITNLGNLTQGVTCPAASKVVVIKGGDGKYYIRDLDAWLAKMRSLSLTTCLSNVIACIDAATQQVSAPNDTNPNNFTRLDNQKLEYQLPTNSAHAQIIINANKELFGAFLYSPPIVEPEIVSATLNDFSNIYTGDQKTLTVVVKNNGEKGSVRVSIAMKNSLSSVTPTDESKTIDSGRTETFTFNVRPYLLGDEVAHITAEGIGIGSSTATTDVPFNIKQKIGSCGNNVCEFGEQLNCPNDCIVPKHLACIQNSCQEVVGTGSNTCDTKGIACGQPNQSLTCALFEKKVIANQTTYLIDLGLIKLIPTDSTSVETCQTDLTLVLLIILAIGVIGFALSRRG